MVATTGSGENGEDVGEDQQRRKVILSEDFRHLTVNFFIFLSHNTVFLISNLSGL
jgi:hypothetical protein